MERYLGDVGDIIGKIAIWRDSSGDRSSQVLYLAQGRGGDSTLALGDLTSTLKVAMASSMGMAKARFHAERWTRFTSVKRVRR
ncbi:hypothetical protein Acr_13g0012090 [Actinidia rufa]|uniref:Uncharacterized protein n=1 Tax=Actinidia rufa TaxID=165716 RepID=A0A7J0FNS3_9ERIC|nr:hypothetical protein Acr_13g0012090 [Actinidia rufa]